MREAADDRLPSPRCAAGFRLEQNALIPLLDDELSTRFPSMGHPERLRKNDLALCRQFRRLIHGKITGKTIAGCQKSSKLGSGRSTRDGLPNSHPSGRERLLSAAAEQCRDYDTGSLGAARWRKGKQVRLSAITQKPDSPKVQPSREEDGLLSSDGGRSDAGGQPNAGAISSKFLHFLASSIGCGNAGPVLEPALPVSHSVWMRVATTALPKPPRWSDAARRYQRVRQRLDELSDEERELRNRLLGLCDSRRAFGAGVELIRTSRKGAVNYGAIPELEGVDLDRYRKEPVEVVKINILASSG